MGKILIAQLSHTTGDITAGMLRADQKALVIGGYGEYELRAIYPLLSLDARSVQYQRAAHSWATGKLLQHVWSWTPPGEAINGQQSARQVLVEALWTQFRRIWWRPQEAKQLLSIYFFLREVPEEKLQWSSEEHTFDQLAKLLSQSSQTDCPVAIVNTTQVSGVASRLATLAEQSGIAVIRVTDGGDSQEQSSLMVNAENSSCQAVVASLSSAFAHEVIVGDDPNLRAEQRAELVVLIGQDLADVVGKVR